MNLSILCEGPDITVIVPRYGIGFGCRCAQKSCKIMHAFFTWHMLDRTVFQLNEIVNEIKGDCYTVGKTVWFLWIRHEMFSCNFLSIVRTCKSSEPCMDLRAYISLRQRSIDLRRNLWSADIEQCVMHALHSNTIPVRAVHEYQKL